MIYLHNEMPNDKKNPYWYRQGRQRNGWWGHGNVGPERKPVGFLTKDLDKRVFVEPKSKSYLNSPEGKEACNDLGLRPDQMHKWIEDMFGDDPAYNHAGNSLTGFKFSAPEVLGGSDAHTFLYTSPHGTPEVHETKLTLRVYVPRNGAKPEIHLGYISLPKTVQGGGTGQRVLKLLTDLADHTGADKITLTANIDIGGYAWARYGFIPSPESWKETCKYIRKQLDQITGMPTLSTAEGTALRGLIKTLTAPNSNPKNIRAVAAIDVPCYHTKLKDTRVGFSLLRLSKWDSEANLSDPDTIDHLKAASEGHEAWTDEDYDELVKPIENYGKKSIGNVGVLFSNTPNGREDAHLHRVMLPAGSLVADATGIRMLMKMGLTRAEARRYISSSRGYGG